MNQNRLSQVVSRALPTAWRHPSWKREANAIIADSNALIRLGGAELLERAFELKWRVQSGEPLSIVRRPAFALVREAARRAHNQPHFETQLLAGIALTHDVVAEMQTGEGKSLTAILPAFLHALRERGCHVVTANDYLAERDAEYARPIFAALGMQVGCVKPDLQRESRREAYSSHVTFGAAREFGFDFLRDRLLHESGDRPVQRDHYFAIVDEADNVLIDDAVTPLLIAAPSSHHQMEALTDWGTRAAADLRTGTDFVIDAKRKRVQLTNAGSRKLMLRRPPAELFTYGMERFYAQVENALTALHVLQPGRDYTVGPEGVGIIDESSGRVSEGRQWQAGLHQAVESKEAVAISPFTETVARISVQNYFRRYQKLAGLTGTARGAESEFRRVYRLGVTAIPTRTPCRRTSLPTRLFPTLAQKYDAIAVDTARRSSCGQAVLVGTPSVNASEALSKRLDADGIPHVVLNCRNHAREAEIISTAGQPGKVTIATNMAGRGADIPVHARVHSQGGLHVIATELHSHERIDRQLVGRTARQGAPGSFQRFLSLQDEIFQHGEQTPERNLRSEGLGDLPPNWLKLFQRVQSAIARRNERQRRRMLQSEKDRDRTCRQLGLDPVIEVVDD